MSAHAAARAEGVRALRLLSPDPEAARMFYSAVTLRRGAPGAETRTRVEIEAGDEQPARWIVGFGVQRLDEIAAACLARGARVLDGSVELGSIVVADPQGIPFELVTSRPADDEPVEGDVVLADVYTRHVDEAVRFYAAAFALDLDVLPDDPVDYMMLSSNGRHLAGVLDMTSFLESSTRDQWIPYFHFSNLDAAIERATALGAWVLVPTTDSPTGRYAIVKDPQGCLFGLWDAASLRHGET
jgi:uncharacterized protein